MVSVGHAGIEIRERVGMDLEAPSGERVARSTDLDNLCDNVLELVVRGAGDDGGRRLVHAEVAVITDICRGGTQEVGICIHDREYTGECQEEQLILVRTLVGV